MIGYEETRTWKKTEDQWHSVTREIPHQISKPAPYKHNMALFVRQLNR
jgi:hypothetical protein